MDSGPRISDFLETHYLPDRIGLSAGYVAELRRIARRLGNPLLRDLSKPMVSAYLCSLQASAYTVNSKRSLVSALWSEAHQQGLAPPLSLPRRMREPIDPPIAWTSHQVGALLKTADAWQGCYSGVSAGCWWGTLFSVTYWTAARVGALLKTPWANVNGNHLLVAGASQKNRRGQLHRLPEHCALPPVSGELIWPWPHCERWFYTIARRIIEQAGLDAPKTGRNLFHKLRRTTLSYCAAIDPAIAQRQGGHRDYATTQRHYIDPRIAEVRTAADVLPIPGK